VYSTTISGLALQAVASAAPVTGSRVAAKKRLIFETADNAGLLALLYAGQAGCFVTPNLCVPIMRAKTPPWIMGNVIGTVVSAIRVGDVLFTGTPGEPYPQIAFGIQDAVDAGAPGVADISHHFLASLADDQLGYLIAPTEGVPAAAEQTALTGNDNFLFNVAAMIGDHVMCTATSLALPPRARPVRPEAPSRAEPAVGRALERDAIGGDRAAPGARVDAVEARGIEPQDAALRPPRERREAVALPHGGGDAECLEGVD